MSVRSENKIIGLISRALVVALAGLLTITWMAKNQTGKELARTQLFAQAAMAKKELPELAGIGATHFGQKDRVPELNARVGRLRRRLKLMTVYLSKLPSAGISASTQIPALDTLAILEAGLAEVLKDVEKNRVSLDKPVPSFGSGSKEGRLRLQLIHLAGTGPDHANLRKQDLLSKEELKTLLNLLQNANLTAKKGQITPALYAYLKFLNEAHKSLSHKNNQYILTLQQGDMFNAARILQTQGYLPDHIEALMLPVIGLIFEWTAPEEPEE